MTWGLVAVGVGTVAGGVLASSASKDAAGTQADAANNASALSQANYQQTRADAAPFRSTGVAGNATLASLLGLGGTPNSGKTYNDLAPAVYKRYADAFGYGDFNSVPPEYRRQAYAEIEQQALQASSGVPDSQFGSLTKNFTGADLQNEPGYQFRLNEGQKAIERSASAKGGLYSGATLKSIGRYGQDYASNEYGAAFNRDLQSKQAKYNFLAGVSGSGQTATAQVDQLGAVNAGNVGNMITSAGAARGAGIVGSANAINSSIGNGINAYQNYSMLNRLAPQTPAAGGNIPFND